MQGGGVQRDGVLHLERVVRERESDERVRVLQSWEHADGVDESTFGLRGQLRDGGVSRGHVREQRALQLPGHVPEVLQRDELCVPGELHVHGGADELHGGGVLPGGVQRGWGVLHDERDVRGHVHGGHADDRQDVHGMRGERCEHGLRGRDAVHVHDGVAHAVRVVRVRG